VKVLIHKIYGTSIFYRKILLKIIENKLIDVSQSSIKGCDLCGMEELFDFLSKN
jgi:hypothetical protein